MSRGHKPRRPRPIGRNILAMAVDRVTKLTPLEQRQVLDPLRAAVTSMKRGVATEFDWATAVTAVSIGDAIESQGVVRGLAGHLLEIDLALQGIGARARATGEWRSTAMYYQEIDLLDLLVDLHGHQLANLSHGEFQRARDLAIQQTRSAGGRVISQPQPAGATA